MVIVCDSCYWITVKFKGKSFQAGVHVMWLYSSLNTSKKLSLTCWTSQQILGNWGEDRIVTLLNVCMEISRHLITLTSPRPWLFMWTHILYASSNNLSSSASWLLRSPSFCCSSKSSSPSLRCWIIETDWSSCSRLCVRVERDRGERKRQKRGRYGGQTHPCLKRGFCREPQAGCQVCHWCSSGRFLTLWD